MNSIRVILGDQLSHNISALDGLKKSKDVVVMMEVEKEFSYVPHHVQKIVLLLSAMRHFASELLNSGTNVDYFRLEDPDTPESLSSGLEYVLLKHMPKKIIITEPSEWRLKTIIEKWRDKCTTPVEIRQDNRFFASHEEFSMWTHKRKTWRMEQFYRVMRRKHEILLDGSKPIGGKWNFDSENRRRLPSNSYLPPRKRFQPDKVTEEVIALVGQRFGQNFGEMNNFGWPVTRAEAIEALEDFIANALPSFGTYQDAMQIGEPYLFHSLIAPALNIGLLNPKEVCAAAEREFWEKRAPLNAVEGFVRQIVGWREYVRGVYWQLMPSYADSNALDARRSLPDFYWTGQTDMKCLQESLMSTHQNAYSHHIQRLMVTGNFALLARVAPREIERWYLAVYADAFEWVEMPNTLGMAVFADYGKVASKPYAASGAYINRMSNFCKTCVYDVNQKTGPRACPFNYLYWAFLIENEEYLKLNPRMFLPYKILTKWSADSKTRCINEATKFLDDA